MRTHVIAATLAAAFLSGSIFAGQSGDDGRRMRPRDDRPAFAGRDDDFRPRRMHRGMHAGMGVAMGMGMGAPLRRLADLDLTAEQRTKAVDILTANYKAMLEARFMMIDAAGKLRDARKEKLGDEELIAAHRDMGEAMGRLQALRGKAVDQIKDILTDGQKAEFDVPMRRPHRRPDMRPGPFDRDDRQRMGPPPESRRDRRNGDRWDRRDREDRRQPRHRWRDRHDDMDDDFQEDASGD